MTTYSPAEVGERWGVAASKVRTWIASGELRAFNVATKAGTGRPRYRIPLEAVVEFEARRTVAPPAPRARKRGPRANVREYIR